MSHVNPGAAFLVIIFGALIAFEIFNYSTTDHALQDLLGNLQFGGLRWSTVLALAFCGIDFAGIARLFTPEQGLDEPKEVWYLFGAWLLAATMNAVLTWWGVSMAISSHRVQSSAIIDPKTITTVVPLFVAVMVWVIRILIIGTLSLAMDRLLHGRSTRSSGLRNYSRPQPALSSPSTSLSSASLTPRPSLMRSSAPAQSHSARPAPAEFGSRLPAASEPSLGMPEPSYHSLSMKSRNAFPTPVFGEKNNGPRRMS
jgi:hypothetical protein